MRLFFIRHGDPDYDKDGLTEKGITEAGILAKHIKALNLDDIYVSPLGRASETASYSLDALGADAVVCDWLREFSAAFDPYKADDAERSAYTYRINKEAGLYEKRILWDILPSYYLDHPELFDKDKWRSSKLVSFSDMTEKYDQVISSFDDLLLGYGYVRSGSGYRVENGNSKNIGFFCHFGITSVLLSRLWNISPFIPLQFLATAPTSVTEVVTEERQKGIAIFRALRIGDISHLAMEGEPPSFAARFCERFENTDERH
ncbi:MAG: histidine phosphatase family protein [Lachnospiraceae bacterium]|nr:histidine phosphatase family protein [Lachnospiraceae bacterium]